MSTAAEETRTVARLFLETLTRTHAGRELSDDAIRKGIDGLLALASPARAEAGAVLAREGDVAEGAFLVVAGKLRASVRTGQGDRVVNEAAPGEIIGEAGIFMTKARRSATLTAVEGTTYLVLGRGLFGESAHNPAVIAVEQHLLQTLVRRIANTDTLITRAWREAAQGGRPALDGLSLLLGGGS